METFRPPKPSELRQSWIAPPLTSKNNLIRNLTSLRTRLLAPLIAAAVLSSMVVALGSAYLGRQWATEEMHDRYSAIQASLRNTSFPLTQPVIESLALLTSTDWIIMSTDGRVITSTIKYDADDSDPARLQRQQRNSLPDTRTNQELYEVTLGLGEYFAGSIRRSPNASDLEFIQVLFDKRQISASSRRAALAPLLTGLSTICLITLMMLAISSRLVGRLQKLEQRVGSIAKGNFTIEPDSVPETDQANDEIGRLFAAVQTMADQLAQLWEQVHRQESAKLLHQIAAGMAHQLRNTLTGARIAIELHAEKCPAEPKLAERNHGTASPDSIDPVAHGQDVQVALRQLTMAEDYVTRLTALGTDSQNRNQPASAVEALRDVQSVHEPIARHLGVDVTWDDSSIAQPATVSDGPAFSAAISNLLLNAMQASNRVRVESTINADNRLHVFVTDNGPGIDPNVTDSLFDPFVTTKPEGMGLGLALVQRVAEQLGGNVGYRQHPDETVFEFVCQIEC